MTQHLRIGDPVIEIRLRPCARARRFVLRVPNSGPNAVLTVPRHAPRTAALDFVTANEGWLRERLASRGDLVPAGDGVELPFLGRCLRIEATGGAGRLSAGNGILRIPGRPELAPARAKGFLREIARQHLGARAAHHAAYLGRTPGRLTLRDTRSRWGSCTSEGDLMFSWRLVMAPWEVLDYVAAHEVAHLLEMNHSQRFWRVVAGLCPEYELHRNWLRQHGAGLHRYDFTVP